MWESHTPTLKKKLESLEINSFAIAVITIMSINYEEVLKGSQRAKGIRSGKEYITTLQGVVSAIKS